MATTLEVLIRLILTLIVIWVPLFLFFKKVLIPAIRNARLSEITLLDDTIEESTVDPVEDEDIDEADYIQAVEDKEEEEVVDLVETEPTELVVEPVHIVKPFWERELEDATESEETHPIETDQDLVTADEPEEVEEDEETNSDTDSDTEETPKDSPAMAATKREKHLQAIERIKFSALSYKERGKLDKYEKKLIEWLALEPEHDEFLEMLSNHYFQQWSEVKALSLLKRVIAMNPENHKSIWQVAQIYRNQNKDDAARILIEKAIMLKPDNPKYLISLVELHYDNGELKEAISIMETLTRLRPTNTDYVLTLATLHEELHQPTDAQKYFMKVLEIDPHNEYAKKWLKRVAWQ